MNSKIQSNGSFSSTAFKVTSCGCKHFRPLKYYSIMCVLLTLLNSSPVFTKAKMPSRPDYAVC